MAADGFVDAGRTDVVAENGGLDRLMVSSGRDDLDLSRQGRDVERTRSDVTVDNPDAAERLVEKAEEGQCLVRMQRVGAWLLVEDNMQCGGSMVTFTGLYRRDQRPGLDARRS